MSKLCHTVYILKNEACCNHAEELNAAPASVAAIGAARAALQATGAAEILYYNMIYTIYTKLYYTIYTIIYFSIV